MTDAAARILLVEDNPGDARMIRELLRELPDAAPVEHVTDLAAALEAIGATEHRLVLTDLGLPDSDGLATAIAVIAAAPSLPVVVLTGNDDERLALDALKAGAQDFLIKGEITADQLRRAMRYAEGRKEVEQQARRAEEHLRAVIEGAPISIFATDERGIFTLHEGQALARVGMQRGDNVGRSAHELFGDLPVTEASGQVITGRDVLRRVFAGESLTGRTELAGVVFDNHFSPLRGPQGRVRGFLGIATDVTTRVHALRDREALEHQLRQAQKMEAIGALAGGVAHDFNNLLTVILSCTEYVLDSLPADAAVRDDLLEIKKASDSATALTRQLLTFSRQRVTRREPVDVNGVVAGVERLVRRLLGEAIEVVHDLAAGAGGLVMADAGHLEQVLLNLVVNARDAMPRGGRLTITTADVDLDREEAGRYPGVAPGAYVELAVADTGEGMDEATRERIFEPFFTTKAPGKGTGLGLAMVYGIVGQVGGAVEVTSEVGAGSTFRVLLPRVTSSTVAVPRPAPSSTEFGGTETILLVEDSEAIRRVTTRILSRAGYAVLAASSGTAALDVAARHAGAIHLVLTDVVMPGLDGPALVEALRRRRPDLRVLYMTGYADATVVHDDVVEAGRDLIGKPFSALELRLRVRRALDAPTPGAR
ncbi:MAG: response regulator [Kofleriaceae bacterium]|nr:response regulator [Kofleriaceae bacterium]MCB9573335.1 response regulator [Kofleriaceae bacterium]